MRMFEHIPGESVRLAVLELMLLIAAQSSPMGGYRHVFVRAGIEVGGQISLTTSVRCSTRTSKNESDRFGNIDNCP